MDTRGQFDVTDVDLRTLIKAAFDLSRPQGLGFLHHSPNGLTEAELDAIMSNADERGLSLDYVRGRSLKFHVNRDRETGRSYVRLDWYDHSRAATEQLMRDVGLADVETKIEEVRRGRAEQEAEYAA